MTRCKDASWRAYLFTSREVVAQYWSDLETFCLRPESKLIVGAESECMLLPEATDVRNWIFQSISVQQRMVRTLAVHTHNTKMSALRQNSRPGIRHILTFFVTPQLLDSHMPKESLPSAEHPRVLELAELTRLPAITVWRYLEKELSRKRRKPRADRWLDEEEVRHIIATILCPVPSFSLSNFSGY